jgi:hypothetical protein
VTYLGVGTVTELALSETLIDPSGDRGQPRLGKNLVTVPVQKSRLSRGKVDCRRFEPRSTTQSANGDNTLANKWLQQNARVNPQGRSVRNVEYLTT